MHALLYATALNPVNYAPLIYTLVALIVVVGAIAGYLRGIKRQFVRSVTIIIAFFAAYGATSFGYHYLNSFLADKTMGDVRAWLVTFRFIKSTDDVSWLYSIDINAVRELIAIPISLVIRPVLFVSAFVALHNVLLILHKIIAALCGFKRKKNNTATRVLGLILGTLQGVFVSIVVLTPIVGISGVAKEAMTVMKEYAPNEGFTQYVEEKYDAYAEGISENPLIEFYATVGADELYEKLSTATLDGETFNMTAIIPDAVKIASDSARLWDADAKNLTPENEAAIERIIASIRNNLQIKKIVSGAVSSAAYLYTNGIFPIDINEPFRSVINSAVGIFHTSSADNICNDLDTVADVYFILSQDGVLNSFDEGSDKMLEALTSKDATGETAVNRVVTVIRSNERTKPLVSLVTKLSVTVMANKAGIDEKALETFDNIKTGISDNVLTIEKENYATEEEYVKEISDALDTTLKENEIELEKGVIDKMAEYVSEHFSDVETLTDEGATDIIFSYYDAYLEYLETGKTPQN